MAARTEIERLGLGRLERLDLKSFWGEQLPDLTPWFLQNIDLLSQTLGIDITPLEREINVDTGAAMERKAPVRTFNRRFGRRD